MVFIITAVRVYKLKPVQKSVDENWHLDLIDGVVIAYGAVVFGFVVLLAVLQLKYGTINRASIDGLQQVN